MIATNVQLGIGIYTPAEAAFYARVPTQTMTRWLFGDAKGLPVVTAQIGTAEDKTVTFLDLVQALAIRAIRVQYKIPLSKIRLAVEKARDVFDVEYPFVRHHTTYLLSDQTKRGMGELVIRLTDDKKDKFVQLTGRASSNLLMKEIAEPFLADLHFDPESGLASEYTAWKEVSQSVVLNPERRFGEPIVMPCGYTAQTLFDAIKSEGSIAAAADAYGVTPEDVSIAYSYIDHLMTTSV